MQTRSGLAPGDAGHPVSASPAPLDPPGSSSPVRGIDSGTGASMPPSLEPVVAVSPLPAGRAGVGASGAAGAGPPGTSDTTAAGGAAASSRTPVSPARSAPLPQPAHESRSEATVGNGVARANEPAKYGVRGG